jgi:hypothetical protein
MHLQHALHLGVISLMYGVHQGLFAKKFRIISYKNYGTKVQPSGSPENRENQVSVGLFAVICTKQSWRRSRQFGKRACKVCMVVIAQFENNLLYTLVGIKQQSFGFECPVVGRKTGTSCIMSFAFSGAIKLFITTTPVVVTDTTVSQQKMPVAVNNPAGLPVTPGIGRQTHVNYLFSVVEFYLTAVFSFSNANSFFFLHIPQP